ncbi:MAG: putative metallopeptidase [Candidatus Aenigmatarchaeota archaeon]
MIRYEPAPDIQEAAMRIIRKLGLPMDPTFVMFVRSHGSKAMLTTARCHSMSRIMRTALGHKKSFYVIEVISEAFDKMSDEEKIKTIIHELMHVPKSMGGGFLHHSNHVTRHNVDTMYRMLKND